MVRKGRTKESIAGERYDSNAIPVMPPMPSRVRRQPGGFNPADFMGMLGGGGGMPDMSQMMNMMQGMGGIPPMNGLPGMPGTIGMMPPMEKMQSKAIYVYGLAEGSPTSRFFTFYPNYLDSKKTLPHVLESSKKYPRDWLVSGRIRVRLVRDDGSLENPEIPNRKTLMLKMAELIPKLQSRRVRLEKEAEEAKIKAATSAGPVTMASGSGKKKGKKKGRK
ncbi:unnamed protein product [Peronospora belbahrii]|uniref:Uncharacterized protein n=1 Tax=Peronospora belbahrii TaxID=622444 RepID=A0AAU9KW93_9STRA|nr:unnamed protein product [Peronospora belbahrii]